MPVTRAAGTRSGPVGGRSDLRFFFEYSGPSSYTNTGTWATSGESLTAADLDLGTVEIFPALTIVSSAAGAVRLGAYDYTNKRLHFFVPDTGAEVANGTDLSGYTAQIEVIGY